MDLVTPYMRSRSKNGLTTVVQQKISLLLGYTTGEDSRRAEDPEELPPKTKVPRRCGTCLRHLTGAGQKRKKNALAKVQSQCHFCGKAMC